MGYKIYIVAIAVATASYFVTTIYFPSIVHSPIVEVSTGKLQGKISLSRDGRQYFEYLQIPYANPPIGNLRYELPEKFNKKWDGVRDATQAGSRCTQMDHILGRIDGSEDCLFINIHTPKLGVDAKLPVLVWIHGGVFAFGSADIYRADYFMDEDVVLVTLNYRLASFGFLNTGDGLGARGNMGLKDQTMALKYIQENIDKFGGNRNDVTIMGESAGGASVHFHILSPMSKGLFHKAIAQSGLSTMPWAMYQHPAKQAKRFAQKLNCPIQSTPEMMKCLKSKDTEELIRVHEEIKYVIRPAISNFVPTVELDLKDGNAFLLDIPEKILESGNYNKVPFLSGVNSEEGLIFAAPTVANRTLTQSLVNDWENTLRDIILLPEDTSPVTYEKIKSFYLHGDGLDMKNPMAHYTNLTNMFGDWLGNFGFHKGMKAHNQGNAGLSPLFIYYYTYHGEFGLDELFLAMKGDYHPVLEILWFKVSKWFRSTVLGHKIERYGACHGDEMAMEFYMPMLSSNKMSNLTQSWSRNQFYSNTCN